MRRGTGRRNAVWALFWIALLGSGAFRQGSDPAIHDADHAPNERLIAEHEFPEAAIAATAVLHQDHL